MAAQRAAKILGIFVRLKQRDGKPGYLRHLPRIEAYISASLAHPTLQPLRNWFTKAGIGQSES
jgi:aminoglycoside/choline kinase family phosphotransferase